jgi:hypothetical protein
MEKRIDESLLISDFKSKEQFAREWRQFNSIDTESGWREMQRRVPSLRPLRFDGTFVGPRSRAEKMVFRLFYFSKKKVHYHRPAFLRGCRY